MVGPVKRKDRLPNDRCEVFSIEVDWDIDKVWDDGCHGTDDFYPDDPLTISFAKCDDGDVFVDLKYNDKKYDFKMDRNGHLYKNDEEDWRIPNGIARVWVKDVVGTVGASLNRDFRACYQDTENSLLLHEQMIVDRFFDALQQAFYHEYECSGDEMITTDGNSCE